MQTTLETHRAIINRQIRERNTVSAAFFAREAARLARVSRLMAERFLRGGRLLTFGSGAAASDAQHIAVEFVHPVLVGKRALPALDLSAVYRQWLPVGLRSEDIVIGLGPPAGDPDVETYSEGEEPHRRVIIAPRDA